MRAHGDHARAIGNPSRGAPCLDAKNDGGDMESRQRVPVRQERRHGWPRLKHRQSQNRKNDERNRESLGQQLNCCCAFDACDGARHVRDIHTAACRGPGGRASINRRGCGRTLAAPRIGFAALGFVSVAAAERRQLSADATIGVCAAKPGTQHSGREELEDHEKGDQDGQVAPHVLQEGITEPVTEPETCSNQPYRL